MTQFVTLYGGYSQSYPSYPIYYIHLYIDTYSRDYWDLYGKNRDLRKHMCLFLNIEQKNLSLHLKKEYHCLTTLDRKRYIFTTQENCEMACEYLNSLLVAKELNKCK